MALPSNIEKYKSAINAADVNAGIKAADNSYFLAWAPLHTDFWDDCKEYSGYYNCDLRNSTDFIPEDQAKIINPNLKHLIIQQYSYNETLSGAKKEIKTYQDLIKKSTSETEKESYQKIIDDINLDIALLKTYKNAWTNWKLEWERDLLNAKNLLKQPTDSNGKSTDGSGTETIEIEASLPEITVTPTKAEETQKTEAVLDSLKNMYTAWDPRLKRADYFLMKDENDTDGIRVPFASFTAATAFSDQTWKLESGIALPAFSSKNLGGNPMVQENVGLTKLFKTDIETALSETEKAESSESTNSNVISSASQNVFNGMRTDEKLVMQNTDELYKEDKFWGAQSIMNPYSLTRLTGGFSQEGRINYMYDIRDRRRFYGMSVSDTDDVLSVSNPTVTQIIEWGNADAWGRTPYTFEDFVYCKYFGQIPNNRLITFRRYAAPCVDNLQFENMFGAHEETTKDASGNIKITKVNANSEENVDNKIFSPHASVITWFGGESGNNLSSLINFSTGTKWSDLQSKQHEVSGNEGESKQAVIDRLLADGGQHTGLYGGAEYEPINSLLESGSWLTAKVTSFGKFDLAMNGSIGMDQAAFDKISGANTDPYEQTLENRIKGPVNRIDAIKKRDAGIEFNQTLSIKCSYSQKSIGGINPKAALLDCLGNCLEMASPHAVFWGGSYRFMIQPQLYPFHDGGWRDSFMAKIYDGNFLGNDGAIATVFKGIKKLGTDANGDFSMDTVKSMLGGSMSIVASAIQSVADMFGGSDLFSSVASIVNDKGAGLQGVDSETASQTASGKLNNLFGNLEQLWHNKMIAETTLPKITGMGGLLIGAPVGEWHLTIGNPFNPIAVIGNLVCSKMNVEWDDELGPDDFPMGFTVTYDIQHGMARDSDAIQSMFNRGMGKFYALPDYMSTSSDGITYVDKYTKDNGHGDTGVLKYKSYQSLLDEAKEAADGAGTFQTTKVSGGTRGALAGNYNTQLVTKFSPLNNLPRTTLTVKQIKSYQGSGTIAVIKSLAATRKLTGE